MQLNLFLNKRLAGIFQSFLERDGWLPDEMASHFEVSTRTIRTDIKKLNDSLAPYGAEIALERQKGYHLLVWEKEAFDGLCEQFNRQNVVQDDPDYRVQNILKSLLLSKGYTKLEDLADQMFISRATLNNDMKNVRRILTGYHLELSSKPGHGVRVDGEEKNIRFCLAKNLSQGSSEIGRASALHRFFDMKELEKISTILTAQFRQHSLNLPDIALENLIIHTAISIERIRTEHPISVFATFEAPVDYQQLAGTIVSELEETFSLEFSDAEKIYFLLQIMSKVRPKVKDGDYMADEQHELVMDMLEYIYKRHHYDLRSDTQLKSDLISHLKAMFYRIRFNMNMKNPLLDHIKINYPVAYEVTLGAVKGVQDRFPSAVNDDELGYLVLHIGAALERKYFLESDRKKVALIVCGTGLGTARLLETKLRATFRDLVITDIISLYEYEHRESISEDIVISTVKLSKKNKPVAIVSPFLTEDESKQVEAIMNESILKSTMLTTYFRPILFRHIEDKVDKESLLKSMSEQLEAEDFVDHDFHASVLERESLGSTAIGKGIAIPHPLGLIAKETIINIAILDHPVEWNDGHEVGVVFLIAMGNKNYEEATKIYDLFIEFTESKKYKELLKCRSFEDFVALSNVIMDK